MQPVQTPAAPNPICWSSRASAVIDTLAVDLRAAAAGWRRDRGFAVAVVVMLAAGIGASTGFFCTLNDVVWRAPPGVTATAGLVALGRVNGDKIEGFTYPGYLAYRAQLQSFAALPAHRGANVVLRDGGPAVQLRAALITEDFFAALRLRIAPGRDFRPEEHSTPGAHPVVIVSHRLWQGRFHGDPALVGRTLQLNGTAFTVVGIAPPRFGSLELGLGDVTDLWIPLMMEGRLPVEFPVLANDLFTSLAVIGRLRPDVSPAQAEAELATVAWRIEEPDTATGRRPRVLLSPHLWCWRPSDRAQAFSILLPLLALAGLVLAIGCANFANFLLARATSRRKEIAVRLALGAPRARVIRQLVGESVLLALAAALPALGIAWALAGWFWRLIGLPVETSLDGRVIAYALGLTLLVGVASGLAPAWQATRRDLARDLKAETGQTTRRRATLPTLLLVGQVAAALVLLHAAGLFVRTVNRLTAVDFGFAPDNLLLVRPDFSLTEYSPARRREFQREFADRVASLPTVRSVSHTAVLPRANNNFWGTRQVVPTGDPAARGDTRVQYNQVDPGFFATLGVPLRRGRDFNAHDTPTSAAVAIVNEALAAQVWPGADPLGRRFRFGDVMFSPEYEVIGVAPNLRVFLREDRPPPQVYLALAQTNNPAGTLLVRLAGEMPAFTRLLRELIRELDPNLPPPEIESFSTYLKNRHAGERMYAILATGLGSIALLLAALGLASLLAYHVAQRQREIGLRLALGATPSGVLALVLREGMAIVLTGQVVGGLAIVAGSRLIARQLFGVAPLDPISAGASILVVGTVALLACWLPARRAARVDPLVALRCD